MSERARVFVACSLDGFIAGEGDDLSWLPQPTEDEPMEDHGYEAFMAETGALLMGRRTYDTVRGFGVDWPYGDTPVVVATRRALDVDPPSTARAMAGPIEALVAQALEAAGGRDVYLDGGDIIRQALDAGLVDELIVTLIPVVLGEGQPLFAGVTQRHHFELAECRTLSHGMVQLRLVPRANR
jgi:dihydrofolate reductase